MFVARRDSCVHVWLRIHGPASVLGCRSKLAAAAPLVTTWAAFKSSPHVRPMPGTAIADDRQTRTGSALRNY